MPELPDIVVYLDALQRTVVGQELEHVHVVSPFILRTVDPPLEAVEDRVVAGVRRLGKRVVLELTDDLYLVFHLMIAGRFRWMKPDAKPPGRIALAALYFPNGTLMLTEASQQKRASLHVVRGEAGLARHQPGGLEVLEADEATFIGVLRRESHTLKCALTDPRLFSGIGNAYSDEILHAARLSPVKLTRKLTDEEAARLYAATQQTLRHWMVVLLRQFAGGFPGPGDITAFRPDFAVHGRFRKPCPVCARPVQRIRYADHETNYCAKCQNDGKRLADRSLSRLLKDDWPRLVEDM